MSILLKAHHGNSGLTNGQILHDPWLFLAFGFGSGLFRKMPGTLGTLAAVPLYGILSQFGDSVYLTATFLSVAFGVPICGYAAKKLQVHDYGGIVWDEVAGFLITMLGLPADWLICVTGFLLFRVFDIVKPWPIRWLDRHVHGGLGIMLDDVVAALLANICLQWLF